MVHSCNSSALEDEAGLLRIRVQLWVHSKLKVILGYILKSCLKLLPLPSNSVKKLHLQAGGVVLGKTGSVGYCVVPADRPLVMCFALVLAPCNLAGKFP